MSEEAYPILVLSRRFASNGQPWWSCEMHFSQDDVEQRDGVFDLGETLAKCRTAWNIVRLRESQYAVARDVRGQKYYYCSLDR